MNVVYLLIYVYNIHSSWHMILRYVLSVIRVGEANETQRRAN